MEQSKIFGIINKINSVLLLVLLAGGCLLIILGIVLSNRWQDRRAVEVVQDDAGEEQKTIELILGNITTVPEFDTQYVKLRSRASGGKFSGYSGGGETRNVLFFTGSELNTHWLYQNHTFIIDEFSILKHVYNKDKEKALAIYIESIKSDSNGNDRLDHNDLITISLTDPHGEKYTEIDNEVQSVIDTNVVEDGRYLILLLQKGYKVNLKKYSLSTFEMVSEKVINEISKKL